MAQHSSLAARYAPQSHSHDVSMSPPAVARRAAVLSPAAFDDFVQQADVCREQARDAVRLRRYRSACGLFATAISLYRHALSLSPVGHTRRENQVREELGELQEELRVYTELARSMEKPLVVGANPTSSVERPSAAAALEH